MENEKNWYALYTKPKYEKKVADLLAKKKLQCYHPCYDQVQYWQVKRKVIKVPLFTSLVFVNACEEDHSLIKQIDGVSGVLYWMNKPAVINENEIASIRYFLEQHNNIRLERIQVSPDRETMSKTNHAHVQPNGVINIVNEHKICLPSLGYALISEAVVEDTKVEDVKIVA